MNEGEKKVVSKMIAIYCRSRHSGNGKLCGECESLRLYAFQRLDRCPYGEEKPTCAMCPIHCYKEEMRMKIKEVMRAAGPRMLILHPVDTFRHFYQEHRRSSKFADRSKSKN